MERSGNSDFSRQMSQFGRGMAEFGRLMSEWGRQMGDAGRQMSQDISRRMTEDITRRMAAESNGGQANGQEQPSGQANGEAGNQPAAGEAGQGMGESGLGQGQPPMADLGRQLADELGHQMGDYSRQMGDSGRRPCESGSNVVNINVTCSINDVHNGAGGGSVCPPPFGLCSPFTAASPCSPFTTNNPYSAPTNPCSNPFTAASPGGNPFSAVNTGSPVFTCVAPGGLGGVLESFLNGPSRNVLDIVTDSKKFQDIMNAALSSNCIKWTTQNEDGGKLVTKVTGTGNDDCLEIKNGVASVGGIPIDTSIPCFSKRYEPEVGGENRQMLILELDTSRFKGDDVRVTPEKGLVTVHIVHVEQMLNGAEVNQTYDVSCALPEGEADKEDLISYFSDGEKLTIDIYVR